MKKKYLKSVIGIGVGVILLTTAVFANYESASGYTACKNALKKVAFAENFSMDYTTEVTFDDEIYGRMFAKAGYLWLKKYVFGRIKYFLKMVGSDTTMEKEITL